MPDTSDQTPSSETATGQTSTEGTAPASATVESTPPSATPAVPEIDYKAKFGASTAEVQRLRAQLDQQARETLQLRQILSTQTQPTTQPSQPPDDSAIYNTFTDVVLDRNVDGMKRHDRHVVEQAKAEILRDIQGQRAYDSRVQASLDYIKPVFQDANSPLAQATLANYTRLINDPSYVYTVEQASVPVPGSGVAINPHVMRDAAKEARLQLLEKGGAASLAARRADTDGPEPASTSTPDSKPKFNAQTHLTQDERDYCNSVGTKYDVYWKYMNEDIREERLAAGKPITRKRK